MMFSQLLIVEMTNGLMSGVKTLNRDCMEEDAPFIARAVDIAKKSTGDACVIFALYRDPSKSHPIYSLKEGVKV